MTPLRLPYEAEPIRTERLLLRPLRMSDADDHAVYQGDAETVRYLPWPLRDAEQSRAHLVKRTRAVRLEHDHDVVVLAMQAHGRVIGDLTLVLSDPANATLEIGWVLRADARGAGYAAEGARAVLDLAFDRLGAHRVVAQLDARNTDSAALCERLGMRLEARFIRDEWFKGEWTDSLHYAILAP
jgi:RimJ/RimL family protein N-acetyltransferase